MTDSHTLPSACNSEQAGAVVLGYTQASWDNLSGKERQPWSADKHWFELSDGEHAAAALFGYTEKTWESMSDGKHVVSSDQADKEWSQLTTCPKGALVQHPLVHRLTALPSLKTQCRRLSVGLRLM